MKQKTQNLLTFVVIALMCVSLIGCGDIIGGTYTRSGNTASISMDEEVVGTAKLSGKTITVKASDRTFTVSQDMSKVNRFSGIWVGQYEDGTFYEVTIGASLFCVYPYEGKAAVAKYTYEGDTATIFIEKADEMGKATLDGDTLTATIEDEVYTVTKKISTPAGGCSASKNNPFLGIWKGNVDGDDVELVVGEQVWGARVVE